MTDVRTGRNAALLAAWDSSCFAEFPDEVRRAMLHDAFTVDVPPSRPIYEVSDPPRIVLMHRGLARVKLMSKDGRSATTRYATHGDILGLPAILSQGSPAVGAFTVTECEVSMLNAATFLHLAQTDARVSWLLARHVSQILFEAVDFLGENLFGSISQRVSRHLLDLASNSPNGLIVRVDQQEIADAIGSVREVVARTLRKLRDCGLIERDSAGITIKAPSELHRIASGKPLAD